MKRMYLLIFASDEGGGAPTVLYPRYRKDFGTKSTNVVVFIPVGWNGAMRTQFEAGISCL